MFDEHTLRFIGLVLANLKIDSEHKFVWSAIKFEDFEKVGAPQKSNGLAASMFFQNVKDTNFGFVMVETEEGQVDVSFRARTGLVDTSRIAVELGGGGHKAASGAEITGKTFDEAVNLILETAKKHARSSS
jgi:phosphoesterase RecJ-like protein